MLELQLAEKKISTNLKSFIMGIVNCTPDSFYEKSRGGYEEAMRLIEEGADILDIGGESSRPGSMYVSAEEEIKRIIPVIDEIRKKSSIPISVDTRKKAVMEEAYNSGADIVNDISALEDDVLMAPFAAEKKLPVILMHKRGIPVIMQQDTSYNDVFEEVNSYLLKRASYAENAGISSDRIIVDPGIGFGKNIQANKTLIQNCGRLCGGKYNVLMALSRKSVIGEITGREVQDRLYGTLAANLISIQNGASIVRVHDVAPCRDMVKVLSALDE